MGSELAGFVSPHVLKLWHVYVFVMYIYITKHDLAQNKIHVPVYTSKHVQRVRAGQRISQLCSSLGTESNQDLHRERGRSLYPDLSAILPTPPSS